MRVLTRVLILLAIGVALVAVAAAFVAWQLPSLQGTITIGDSGVTLKGFSDPDGDSAGLAMAVAGVTVIGIVLAAVVVIVVGLALAVFSIVVALLATAASLAIVLSPLLVLGWAVWVATRRRRDRPSTPTAVATS